MSMRKATSFVALLMAVMLLLVAAPNIAVGPTETVSYKEGVNGYIGTHDTFIRPDDPDGVMPPYFAMEVVARGGPAFPWLRGVVRFANQDDLPPGANVISAELTMVCQEAVPPGGVPGHLLNGGENVEVYGLLKEFDQSQATWNQHSAGNAWEVPGAEGATDRFATPDDTQFIGTKCNGDVTLPAGAPIVPTPYTWDVTASYLAQLAQGKEEFGWVFFSPDWEENSVRFYTHELAQNGEFSPELRVTYEVPPAPDMAVVDSFFVVQPQIGVDASLLTIVQNVGDLAGTATVEIRVDGGIADLFGVSLAPGEDIVLNTIIVGTASSHDIQVNVVGVVPDDRDLTNNGFAFTQAFSTSPPPPQVLSCTKTLANGMVVGMGGPACSDNLLWLTCEVAGPGTDTVDMGNFKGEAFGWDIECQDGNIWHYATA